MGDFNDFFFNQFKLKSLNKDPACYKNNDKPSCIDLPLGNSAKSFENTCIIETSLTAFHKLLSRYLIRSTNGCFQKFCCTGIVKGLIT